MGGMPAEINYPEIGICGLACRLCPAYQRESESRCDGCKTESRMNAGCSLVTCALKRKGVEFCWVCGESDSCARWKRHRDFGRQHDSFKCYQTLDDDILFIRRNGVDEFDALVRQREQVLKAMLNEFNEGRSKGYYCIAATVLELDELEDALAEARKRSAGLGLKEKSGGLHSLLEAAAVAKNRTLKLRK